MKPHGEIRWLSLRLQSGLPRAVGIVSRRAWASVER